MNKRIRNKHWKHKETRRRTDYFTPDFNPNSYDEMTDIFESLTNIDAIDSITMALFDGRQAMVVDLFGDPDELLDKAGEFAETVGEDKTEFVYFINTSHADDEHGTYLIMQYATDDWVKDYNTYGKFETIYRPEYCTDDVAGFNIMLSGIHYINPKKRHNYEFIERKVTI